MEYYEGLAPEDKLDVFEKLWVATSETEKSIIYKGKVSKNIQLCSAPPRSPLSM